MPSSATCPEDANLLGLALGEPGPAEVPAHVAECPDCQERLERLRAELAIFRAAAGRQEVPLSPSAPPSTLAEPTIQPPPNGCPVEVPSATADRTSDGPAGEQIDRLLQASVNTPPPA